MPHIRMEIHTAIGEANEQFADPDFRQAVVALESSAGFRDLLGDAAGTAYDMLRTEVQESLFAAIKAAGPDRPVFLNWQRGRRGQTLVVESPDDDSRPIDLTIISRYTEDGLGSSG